MSKEIPIENLIILTIKTDNHIKTIDPHTVNFTIIIKLNPNSILLTPKSLKEPTIHPNKSSLTHSHTFKIQFILMKIVEKALAYQINIKENHQETNIKENPISIHIKIIHLLQIQINLTSICPAIPIQGIIKILLIIDHMKETSTSIKISKTNKKASK